MLLKDKTPASAHRRSACLSSIHTSVGATAIRRFLRPVTYQNAPPALLPPELRDDAATLMPGPTASRPSQ